MPRMPAEVTALLHRLAERLPVVLGKNLVGIYAYGSLTQRAFNPKRSDVDCIVVTERDLSDAQFRRLRAWLARESNLNPWLARVQATFLIKNEILTMDSRACLYQFGKLKRGGSDGNPIIWMNVLKSGLVLFGPAPDSFVPEFTSDILLQALRREVDYIREEISEKPDSEWRDVPSYRSYAVLTLCRILYSFKRRTIVSKPRAAAWSIKHAPQEWHDLIRQALSYDDSMHTANIPLFRIEQFIGFVEAQLNPV